MIAESKIRSEIGRYLRGAFSIDQFEDWIAQNSWDMHKDSSEDAQKLASAIELRLAEHSSGHLREPYLKNELRQFLNPEIVRISFGEAIAAPENCSANNSNIESRAQVIVFTSRSMANREVPS